MCFHIYLSAMQMKHMHVYVYVSQLCECSAGHFSIPNGHIVLEYCHYHRYSRVM